MKRALFALLVLVAACGSRSASPPDPVATTPPVVTTTEPDEIPTVPTVAPSTTTFPTTTMVATTSSLVVRRAATDPALVAADINQALATIDDPGASESAIDGAGRLQQLSFGRVATTDGMDAAVLPLLTPRARASLEAFLRASSALSTLVEPQPELPEWQIVAPAPVPELVGYYRAAEAEFGVTWQYLAAIHFVETRFGRIRGESTAGALGPMQFIPTTWEVYGEGDIMSNRDSIRAAARMLVANGAPGDMYNALYRYNPDDAYVVAIESYAGQMRAYEREIHGYHGWQVFYRYVGGTVSLPVGYPSVPPEKVE